VTPVDRRAPSIRLRLQLGRLRALADGLAVLCWPGSRTSPAVEIAPYPKIFVVGCPRSGTTWVQKLLQCHPEVVGSEESHAVKRLSRAVDAGRDPRGWARLFFGLERDHALRKRVGLAYWVERGDLRRYARQALRSTKTRDERLRFLVTAVFDGFVARQGVHDPVLVEKTPLHIRYAEELLRWYPEARIVEVVRDGRDVCASMRRLPPEITFAPRGLDEQIGMWVTNVERGNALAADPRNATRVIRVHYERLRSDPEVELARLFGFVELDASDAFIEKVLGELEFSRAKDAGRGLHMHSGVVGSWREVFSEDEVEVLRGRLSPLLDQLGYTW
jgi:hypothetical protein